MVVASFIILTCSLFYESYSQKGELLDMIAFLSFFAGTKTTILAWMLLAMDFFAVVFIVKLALKSSVYLWLPIYLIHIWSIFAIATYFSGTEGMGFASIMIIMAEAIRMVMKAHSYLRTKLLYLKPNPYRDFEFRGARVVNSESREEESDKHFRINITEGDIFH